MSKRSRTLKKARRRTADGRPVTKVRSPGDTLALVPYLLGFTPHESLVVVSLTAGGKRFGPTFRLDLPPEEDYRELLADRVEQIVVGHGFSPVVVAVFSAQPEVADPFVRAVLDRLAARRVRVVDAFRGDGRSWWSYVCDDPWCCPPEGSPYDADASPAAVDAVLAGMAKAPDREALRAQFAPGEPGARAAVQREVTALSAADVAPLTPDEVATLVPRVLAGAELGPQEQAHLLLSLRLIPQRDQVWGSITRDNAGRHLETWRGLMRLAPDGLLAPVGSLAAFAAWLGGTGVLAAHAVDRVLDVAPDYPMAVLIRQAIDGALDPRVWPSGRVDRPA